VRFKACLQDDQLRIVCTAVGSDGKTTRLERCDTVLQSLDARQMWLDTMLWGGDGDIDTTVLPGPFSARLCWAKTYECAVLESIVCAYPLGREGVARVFEANSYHSGYCSEHFSGRKYPLQAIIEATEEAFRSLNIVFHTDHFYFPVDFRALSGGIRNASFPILTRQGLRPHIVEALTSLYVSMHQVCGGHQDFSAALDGISHAIAARSSVR
jgi:hypothetical protein